MLGLFGTLEMSKRAMDTARAGIELTGHNLSNVSNPAYARQRLKIQTGDTLPSPVGPTGTGSVVSSIEQVRNALLDAQIVTEEGVTGFLEAKQKALEFGEVNLGQTVDRQSSSAEASTAAAGVGGQSGLVEGLSEFFNSLQALSTNPGSTADRQVVLLRAQNLADKFNNVNERLDRLNTDLNTAIGDDVVEANQLLKDISDLSKSITTSELGETGNANDLRDRRQAKIEQLSKLVNLQTSAGTNNTLVLNIGGVDVISDNNLVDSLTTFTSGGNTEVAVASAPTTALTLTGGTIYGTMDARDGAIATLKSDINELAGALITRVNTVHQAGFALDGTTGRAFFSGSDASDISVNSDLLADTSLIQASGDGNAGNNQVALSLARLATESQATLGNLTFVDRYNQTVANFGQELFNVNSQLVDQGAVNRMLARQRDSIGGVSVDEEMTNLVIFQRAFQASAKMITTIDDLLQSVIALSR